MNNVEYALEILNSNSFITMQQLSKKFEVYEIVEALAIAAALGRFDVDGYEVCFEGLMSHDVLISDYIEEHVDSLSHIVSESDMMKVDVDRALELALEYI